MATKEEIQAQIERLEEYDVPTELIEPLKQELDRDALRQKYENELAWRREHGEPAVQKVSFLETQPKRKETLKGVGIDYDSLPQYGKEVLDQIPADKLDDTDFVASFVQSKGFQAQITEQVQTPQSGADQIAAFSSSPLGSLAEPLKAGKVTATDFAGWDTAKQREFMKKHPHAYDSLTRGQEAVI